MTQIDDILEQAKAMNPETYTAILAREVERLRAENAQLIGAISEAMKPYYEGGFIWARPLDAALRGQTVESEQKAVAR